MNIIKYVSSLLKSNKEENEKGIDVVKPVEHNCNGCKLKSKCIAEKRPHMPSNEHCRWEVDIDFDETKDSILILDDSPGMVSFLEDDLAFFEEEKLINLDDYNVFKFSSSYAAFNFIAMQEKYKGLNIKYAVIDITIGGNFVSDAGNLSYTGVDVYEYILKYNKDCNYLFYTGNNLNPYIKSNVKLIEQFRKLTNDDIQDHLLFKTSLGMDKRRDFLSSFVFKFGDKNE